MGFKRKAEKINILKIKKTNKQTINQQNKTRKIIAKCIKCHKSNPKYKTFDNIKKERHTYFEYYRRNIKRSGKHHNPHSESMIE